MLRLLNFPLMVIFIVFFITNIKVINHRKKRPKNPPKKPANKYLKKTRKKPFNIVKEQYFHQI